MYSFENVNFHTIKNKLVEEILNNIYESLILHKHLFLNDRLRFNCLFDLHTRFVFLFEVQELNCSEKINYKPLTIEDFIYRSIEEIIFEYKTYLIQELNKLEENLKLNFFKLTIIHRSFANFL